MDAPSLAVLTASPVTLEVNGKSYAVKPLGITVLGKYLEKLSAKRRDEMPSMIEVLQALKGHESSVVSDAIVTFHNLAKDVSEPTLDELIMWLTKNPIHIAEVVLDCIEGAKPDMDALFVKVLSELRDGGGFGMRWLNASGLGGDGGNPTEPPAVAAE